MTRNPANRAGRVWRWLLAAAVWAGASGLVSGQTGIAARMAGQPEARGGPQSEADALRSQVRLLTKALAAARAEADGLKAELDRRRFEEAGGAARVGPGAEGFTGSDIRVLDVNQELQMVILSGGAQEGLKPGMTFAVVNGDRVVARVRVVDVREKIAGAVVEERDGKSYPQVRDRAVMAESL